MKEPSSTKVRAREKSEAEALPSFRVEVVAGRERGQRVLLSADRALPLLIGSSPSSDLCLSDPLVSRRHLALECSASGLRVTDLRSTNGTYVQGLRVSEVLIEREAVIELGQCGLRVTRDELRDASTQLSDTRFGKVLGASLAMRRLYPLCARLSESAIAVIIEGETGTGKEQLAEALHEAGPRNKAPFVVLDCTAVAPTLMESALFGHERGAFTGAHASKRGCFELAHGGTLLIDEIGDLELALQAKLLRAIERGVVQRVGGEGWLEFDVRVIAATRRDLDAAVHAGRFRDDLFYRLAVARIELPPLRRREGDVTLLARHFWRTLAPSLPLPSDSFFEQLEGYGWPGNVRELHNAVLQRIALGELASPRPQTSEVAPSSECAIERVLSCELPFPRARDAVVAEFERRYVERVLARWDGNVARAAAASGIARRYFHTIKRRQGNLQSTSE